MKTPNLIKRLTRHMIVMQSETHGLQIRASKKSKKHQNLPLPPPEGDSVRSVPLRRGSGGGLYIICTARADLQSVRLSLRLGSNLVSLIHAGFTCLLILFVFFSCRASKEILTNPEIPALKAEKEFYTAFLNKSFHYQTFSARVQFDIVMASGNEMSSRAQLKILKNERLQISVQPVLGIEAFRAELTPDSIKIVDRLNRRILLEPFDKIQEVAQIDFDFYKLQALFTNQLFLSGEISLSENAFNRFRWEPTRSGYLLSTEDRSGLQYAFTADSNEKLSVTEIRDISTQLIIKCMYENFRSVDRQLFPMNINMSLFAENKPQGSLALNFSRVEIDAPLEMSFPIPANYRRASLQEILSSIEQL